jgi:phosphoglycerate dehydrogenase-like enzyme
MVLPKVTEIPSGGCRKSVAESSRSLARLQTLVLEWEFQPELLERISSSLPGVNVVAASGDALDLALADADALVSWGLSDEQLAAAPRLRWFQSISAGIDRLALDAIRERGLIVTNTSGMHATNIAEHILAMMLAFARCLPRSIRAQQQSKWLSDFRPQIFELNGQKLHVVGYGDIGQRLAFDAHALGMRVTATRRRVERVSDDIASEIGDFGRLTDHLALADHVAICLPLTPATDKLFDAEKLEAMKTRSYLYNIGRGPIVDTNALISALVSGKLAGAGLDVTDPEPLPADSPLWQMENVIITGHTSGSSPHNTSRLADIVIDNAQRFMTGQPLRNVVDFDHGY